MNPETETVVVEATPSIDLMLKVIQKGRGLLGDQPPVGEELFRSKSHALSVCCDEVNERVLSSTLLKGGGGAWYNEFVPCYQATTQSVYFLSKNLSLAANVIAGYVAKLRCWRTAMTEHIRELKIARQALIYWASLVGLAEARAQDVSIAADASRKYDTLASKIHNEETELSKFLSVYHGQLVGLREDVSTIRRKFTEVKYDEDRSISVMPIKQMKNASEGLFIFFQKLHFLSFSSGASDTRFKYAVYDTYPKFVENGFRREVQAYAECHDHLLLLLANSAGGQGNRLGWAAYRYEATDAAVADSLRAVLQE